MEQYSKVTAAALAGAVVTVLSVLLNYFKPDMSAVTSNPAFQAAFQTIVTAAVVYFAPPNRG